MRCKVSTEFREYLSLTIHKLKIKQAALAQASKTTQSWLSLLLSGKRNSFDREPLERLKTHLLSEIQSSYIPTKELETKNLNDQFEACFNNSQKDENADVQSMQIALEVLEFLNEVCPEKWQSRVIALVKFTLEQK
jgi:transcriptional regulator with XRE-family HTH domain